MKRVILFIAILSTIAIYATAANQTVDSTRIKIRGTNVGTDFVVSKNSTISFIAYGTRPHSTSHFMIDDAFIGYTTTIGTGTYTSTSNGLTRVYTKYNRQYDLSASNISEGSHTWRLEDGDGAFTERFSFKITYQTINKNVCSHQSTTIYIECFSPKRWEKSTDNGMSWSNISCTSQKYTESNPSAGKVLYRALNKDNTYSDIVTITYVDAVPSTIQALPATNTKTVDESITLTADVEDNGYSYQWKKGGTDISGATKSTYTISTIKSSHAGNYTCYVSNGCNGVTTTTAKLTVNKCTQTIDFPEIPTLTYSSGLTYTLPQKTNKGLTITYQSMNTSVATVSGNVLTIKAPGTAIIAATQVGNADYLEATQVSRTLTVNKRTQVITFEELPEKTYEDLPFTLPQKTNEGLTISYSSTNTSVATVSGNTVTILKPGTTDIIASQAGDATHYAAAEVSQTLTVKKAAQSITFGSLASKTYGDAPFELNKVTDKNLTITYTSSDASIASISGNIVTIHKPGTVTIIASQAGNAYYLAAEPIEQTLSINKANQSINFPPLESRAFDSGDFELLELTDKGQTITYESNNPSVATITNNIVHIVGAGTTEITASQEGNEYYNAAPTVSQNLTITKAYQTIDFPELPSCVYGQEPIQLNATVNSDLPIEYESSDYSIAQINGNELTIIGAGQCYITASVAGNKNYYTATPVERTLIVTKAQPTISFAPLEGEFKYGDEPIALIANSDMGQVEFSSSNPSKLTIIGQNAIIQGAGTFTITASTVEDANHFSASVSQEIIISKANLTVTANNISRMYGDNNPNFTYTFKGFVNGDTKLDLTTDIQVSTEATAESPVGTYEIVPTATTDDNYEILCKKGVLTINKAPLTISTEGTREYGEENPEFVFAYTGFKNEETSTVLSALPQAYTTAKRTSPVGTYPVYISGANAQNYSITYGESVMAVEKAPLTIKALDVTRKRLEENPSFELSITGYKLEETIDVLDKLPTIQCEADVNSPIGTYPITLLNDGYAANYEYILVNGTLTIEKLQFTITVLSQNETMGTVLGGGIYDEEDVIHINAIPNAHYHFVKWEDGNTDINRTVVVSQNVTYTAIFAINQYTITASANDDTKGLVSGDGEYDYGATIEMVAEPYEGYQFNSWSDGNTQNPRQIVVSQDSSLTAIFGVKECSWLVESNDISMGFVSTVYTEPEYNYGTSIEALAIPNSGYKFVKWNDGKTYNPYRFALVEDTYLRAIFMADDAISDETEVHATTTSATFTWPLVIGGYTYMLTVYLDIDMTEPLYDILFDQFGSFISRIFHAPSRTPMEQENGFTYTVTDLNPNTQYYFAMKAFDKDEKLLNTDLGSFKTIDASTNIDQISKEDEDINVQKVLLKGQIFILRGDKTYTITGAEVK